MTTLKDYDAFIFTHIPKCGGSSFRNYVYESAIQSKINQDQLHIPGEGNLGHEKNLKALKPEALKLLRERKIKVIADHSKYGIHFAKNLDHIKTPFYFTILREPTERFVSHYNFFYKKLNYGNCKGLSFQNLERKKKIQILNTLENLQVSYLSPSKTPQRKCNKNDIKYALNLIGSDAITFGLLENMPASLKILNTVMPSWLTLNDGFPFLNKNKSGLDEIPNDDLELIRRYHKFDYDLYNFAKVKFELLSKYN